MDCINLKERFGSEYRISYDPAYGAEYGDRGRTDDPWLQIIPGKCGHIYPHGGELLAVSTNKRQKLLIPRLKAMPGLEIVQDGDDGINATFPISVFDEVAKLIGAKRRRKLSPEQRARLVELGSKNLERMRQAKANPDEQKPDFTIGSLVERIPTSVPIVNSSD